MSEKNELTVTVIKADSEKGYTVEKALDTIEKINAVANNCDYARALVVNSVAKSDLEDWKKPLIERFGYSKDYLNKLVKVADKFLTISKEEVKAIEDKGENVYDIMVAKPSIVEGLHDKNGFDFNISQMCEIVFLDEDILQKELTDGNIKANMTVKAIREVADKYKNKKITKPKSDSDSDDSDGFKCDNDKERLAMAVKLIEAITTDTIKKHKNYAEVLKVLEMFKEYAK